MGRPCSNPGVGVVFESHYTTKLAGKCKFEKCVKTHRFLHRIFVSEGDFAPLFIIHTNTQSPQNLTKLSREGNHFVALVRNNQRSLIPDWEQITDRLLYQS